MIFTDGAYELVEGRPVASIGGVLFDPASGYCGFFAAELLPKTLKEIGGDSANPIAAVELLAVVCAMEVWFTTCRGRSVLAFVDNDSAKHALVKGGSSTPTLALLCQQVCDREIAGRILAYFERVPSASNIADPPSRGIAPPAVPGWPAIVHEFCRSLPGTGNSRGQFSWGVRDLVCSLASDSPK